MEREFKWRAVRADFDGILRRYAALCGAPQALRLDAVYYDTPDRVLRAQRIGLRMRQENGQSVFCVKTGGTVQNGLHSHAEYEHPADTLTEGLRLFSERSDAPAELRHTLDRADLIPLCATHIDRTAVLLTAPDFSAELTFDTGTLAGGSKQAPLSEIELEQKAGDPAAFAAFGTALAAELSLVPEPLSKLARALALAGG